MALVLSNGTSWADVPTLHDHEGEKFTGDVAVQVLQPNYFRKTPEIVVRADGTRGFSQIGDAIGWIDSFVLVAYDFSGVREIKNAIANEESQGLFTLHVPNLETSGAFNYLVLFFDAPFEQVTPRRRGNPRVWSATVTEIDVLGSESV